MQEPATADRTVLVRRRRYHRQITFIGSKSVDTVRHPHRNPRRVNRRRSHRQNSRIRVAQEIRDARVNEGWNDAIVLSRSRGRQ